MNAEVEDWDEKQFGVRLAIGPDEIDQLTENLRSLRKDPDQHFHLSAHGPQENRLRDIEVSALSPGQSHNMHLTSLALAPGVEVPDPGRRPLWMVAPPRLLAVWAFWLLAAYAGSEAVFRAYATFANDYRPILLRGVWMSGIALIALHCATLLSRSRKARISGIAGALLVLSVLGQLLGRLSAYR